MKNYKEMAESALKRIKQYEAKQKRKKKIKQAVIAICSICVVLLVAVGVFKENLFNIGLIPENVNTTEKVVDNISISEKTTSDSKNQTHKKTTKKSKGNTTKKQSTSQKGTIADPNVTPSSKKSSDEQIFIMVEDMENDDGIIYAENNLKGDSDFTKPIAKGSVGVTNELRNAINDNGEERTYAVMVNFEYSLPDNYLGEIKVDGVSATDLKKQADNLLSDGKNEDAKRLYAKINEAKRAYLRDYIDNFEETFSKNGMEIYVEERGTTIENMIFYTYATGDQINNFSCKATEAFNFTLAVKFK